MAVTEQTFRQDMPEFADTTAYPPHNVTAFITLAARRMDPDRWGDLFDYGTELFVAHHLVLQKERVAAAAFSDLPGRASGVIQSEGAGQLNVSYNIDAGTNDGAGHWNLTTFGTQLWELIQLVGAGGVQL